MAQEWEAFTDAYNCNYLYCSETKEYSLLCQRRQHVLFYYVLWQ